MKLKNITRIAVLAALMPLGACNDFLNVEPDSRTELDTEDKIYKLLASAYPTNSYALATEMISDNSDWRDVTGYTPLSLAQDELWTWKDVTEESSSMSPRAAWVDAYSSISSANHALEGIEAMGNPKSLQAARGEALIIRAYNHFILVNLFAPHFDPAKADQLGVPYMSKPEKTVDSKEPRLTVSKVYELIEKDLVEGLPLLEDNSYKVPKYHFNIKAANAFAARFYLYARRYDKVIAHSSVVLGEQPTTMLRDWPVYLTTPQGQPRAQHYAKMEHNTNLLIANVYTYTYSLGNYSTGKKYSQTRTIASSESGMANAPWGVWSSDMYYYPMGNYTQFVSLVKFPYYFQVTNPITETGYRRTLMVLFSAEEALLNRAEAHVMQGDYDSALADMNMWLKAVSPIATPLTRDIIRDYYTAMKYYEPEDPTAKKRLNPPTPLASAEQENFMHCVLHMRRIETIHDGLRWFDVKRWGIEIFRRKLDANETITVLDAMKVDDPRRVIQIPASVIGAGMAPNPR